MEHTLVSDDRDTTLSIEFSLDHFILQLVLADDKVTAPASNFGFLEVSDKHNEHTYGVLKLVMEEHCTTHSPFCRVLETPEFKVAVFPDVQGRGVLMLGILLKYRRQVVMRPQAEALIEIVFSSRDLKDWQSIFFVDLMMAMARDLELKPNLN